MEGIHHSYKVSRKLLGWVFRGCPACFVFFVWMQQPRTRCRFWFEPKLSLAAHMWLGGVSGVAGQTNPISGLKG